jgi:plasmid maintenance system killer protein
VIIRFGTNKLRRCYEQHREANKAWGKPIARKYVQAVDLLRQVEIVSHLAAFRQFAYEPLTGDRKGQHSLKLARRARLIFRLSDGGQALIAHIEEVDVRHYGH